MTAIGDTTAINSTDVAADTRDTVLWPSARTILTRELAATTAAGVFDAMSQQPSPVDQRRPDAATSRRPAPAGRPCTQRRALPTTCATVGPGHVRAAPGVEAQRRSDISSSRLLDPQACMANHTALTRVFLPVRR
jgi:hypothetical protein